MKKMLVMAMMMAIGSAAFAEDSGYAYLYWQVDPVLGLDWSWWLTEGREFDYAMLRAVDQGYNVVGDALGNYDGAGNGPVYEVYSEGDDPSNSTADFPVFGQIKGDGFDYAKEQYGFIVEAYLNGDVLWRSGTSWYADLVANGHVWDGDPSAMSGNITPVSFMVPEPSSGLLVLLGLAGLALRRRRA